MSPTVTKILDAALLAPSADNTQPWEVSVKENVIDLYHVPERDISPYDSAQRGSLVAHGAFIENAVIAAEVLGQSLHVTLNDADSSSNWHIARLTLHSEQPPDNIHATLFAQIEKRTTNRKPYEPQKLTSEQKSELTSISCPDGLRICILDYPQPTLAHAISLTEQVSFENKCVHENLFKNIRWSDKEAVTTRDGFSIRTFELPAAGKIIFRVAQSWRLLSFLNAVFSISKNISKETTGLYVRTGAFIGILGTARVARDYIEVGRLMQRVWLTASALGLSMQPVGAILFFKEGIDSKTTDIFSASNKVLIEEASQDIRTSFAPKNNEKVLFILRAGIAEPPSARTPRRHLSDVLIQKR